MTRSELSKLKRQTIDESDEINKVRMSAIEKKLLDQVLSDFINKLESVDGKIVSNGRNIDLVAALDKVFKEFSNRHFLPVIRKFAKDVEKLNDINAQYFRITADVDIDRIDKVKKEVTSVMRKRMGISNAGEIKPKGYLDRLIKDAGLKNKVKSLAIKAATSGMDVNAFIEKTSDLLIGNKQVNGGLVKFYNTYMGDVYSQTSALGSKLYAEKLELKYFVYQGGLIKASRDFCKHRDGKVFTTEEAQSWEKLVGKENGPMIGKGEPYDPLIDRGGANCRHSIDFISEKMAKSFYGK